MPDVRRLIYWDACVFLDWVNGIPEKLPILDAIIDRAGLRGDVEIVTSTLSITEVAIGRLTQAGSGLDPSIEARIDALWTDPVIKQIEFHRAIAFEARDLVRAVKLSARSLKPMDAIHLATARRIGASEFQTYNDRLLKLPPIVGLPITEPTILQPRLPGT